MAIRAPDGANKYRQKKYNLQILMTGRQNPLKSHPSLSALGPHRCRPGGGNGDVAGVHEDGAVVLGDDGHGDHHVNQTIIDMTFFQT